MERIFSLRRQKFQHDGKMVVVEAGQEIPNEWLTPDVKRRLARLDFIEIQRGLPEPTPKPKKSE